MRCYLAARIRGERWLCCESEGPLSNSNGSSTQRREPLQALLPCRQVMCAAWRQRVRCPRSLAVLSLRGPALFRRGAHLCPRRRRHAALLTPHHHLGRIPGRHLHALRLRRRAPLELTTVLARELINQFGRLAAHEMQRLEHRVPLLQPFPRMRLGRAEQPPHFSRDLFKTRCSSLSQGNLQIFRY